MLQPGCDEGNGIVHSEDLAAPAASQETGDVNDNTKNTTCAETNEVVSTSREASPSNLQKSSFDEATAEERGDDLTETGTSVAENETEATVQSEIGVIAPLVGDMEQAVVTEETCSSYQSTEEFHHTAIPEDPNDEPLRMVSEQPEKYGIRDLAASEGSVLSSTNTSETVSGVGEVSDETGSESKNSNILPSEVPNCTSHAATHFSMEESTTIDMEEPPIVDMEESPIADMKKLPMVDMKKLPMVDMKKSPMVDMEESPMVDMEESPMVDMKKSPMVDMEESPTVDMEESPTVDMEESPTVDMEESPMVHMEESPMVDMKESPMVDTEEKMLNGFSSNERPEDSGTEWDSSISKEQLNPVSVPNMLEIDSEVVNTLPKPDEDQRINIALANPSLDNSQIDIGERSESVTSSQILKENVNNNMESKISKQELAVKPNDESTIINETPEKSSNPVDELDNNSQLEDAPMELITDSNISNVHISKNDSESVDSSVNENAISIIRETSPSPDNSLNVAQTTLRDDSFEQHDALAESTAIEIGPVEIEETGVVEHTADDTTEHDDVAAVECLPESLLPDDSCLDIPKCESDVSDANKATAEEVLPMEASVTDNDLQYDDVKHEELEEEFVVNEGNDVIISEDSSVGENKPFLAANEDQNSNSAADNSMGYKSFEMDSFGSSYIEEDCDKSPSKCKSDQNSLPKCRMTRTYVCEYCSMTTQNPRDHLHHMRDCHGEQIHIYECDSCQYASKNFTKLMRHMQMVHKTYSNGEMEVNGVRKKVKPSKFRALPNSNSDGQVVTQKLKIVKSPKSSYDRLPIVEQPMDYEVEDEDEERTPASSPPEEKKEERILYCEQCEFTCKSRKHMSKHEVSCHLKKTFYRCSKCNYVTHLKGRYAKHVKYHQLPIVKCEYCDFRTPYRWNLDRHLKNHSDDGEFKCHLCNFSASIKQSLTVHVANHHLTPEQIKERELKRTIGISDPQDYAPEDDELELMKMERDEHPDAFQLADIASQSFTVSNIDMGSHDESTKSNDGIDDSSNGESRKKKPKIKLTFKKMKSPKETSGAQDSNERHNFDKDFIHPDDLVHRNGNVYIKNFKCNHCSFKAAFKSDLERHEKKVHEESIDTKKSKKIFRSSSSGTLSTCSDPDIGREDVSADGSEFRERFSSPSESMEDASDESHSGRSADCKDKKKGTFLEDLQEKLSNTNAQNLVCQYCGHNSKCLSESVRHQKLHLSVKSTSASPSMSARCQFCKQHCKSTNELVSHLKVCSEARKNQISDSAGRKQSTLSKNSAEESNHFDHDEDSKESGVLEVDTRSRSASRHSSDAESSSREPSEKRAVELSREQSSEERTPDVDGFISEDKQSSGKKGRTYTKRVYRCPQCKFWSSTASRFHVHIVGHFNKKPYVCSECNYRSNWRWDITKHIKIRISKDHTHKTAEVLINDETAEKNYDKYERYISIIQLEDKVGNGERETMSRRSKTKRSAEATNIEAANESSVVAKKLKQEKNATDQENANCEIQKDSASSKASVPPPMVKIPLDASLISVPSLPKLTRAPNQLTEPTDKSSSSRGSSPSLVPQNPNIADHRSSVESCSTDRSSIVDAPSVDVKSPPRMSTSPAKALKPPPLLALKGLVNLPTSSSLGHSRVSMVQQQTTASQSLLSGGGQYQIITPQVSAPQGTSLTTSLETLQLLAAGSTNVENLQKLATSTTSSNPLGSSAPQLTPTAERASISPAACNPLLQQLQGLEGTSALEALKASLPPNVLANLAEAAQNNPSSKLALQQQQQPQPTAPAKPPPADAAEDSEAPPQLVLDHQGNPEWKCAICNFRDADRSTVEKHRGLAHGRTSAVVSMLHAVHRCDVCAFAAGTKRHVQLHIDSAHGGRGGITSTCEGQNPNAPSGTLVPKHSAGMGVPSSGKVLSCQVCPFKTSKRSALKQHLARHTPKPECIFKCMACPYFVPSKLELLEHLAVHGVQIPASIKNPVNLQQQLQQQQQQSQLAAPSQQAQQTEPRADANGVLHCDSCPFESRSRTKLLHHRQFHRPRDLAFKCPQCSYNVTRRHLLAQHIKVHNLSPEVIEQIYGSNGLSSTGGSRERSISPSPSLTITPINGSSTQDVAPTVEEPRAIPNEEFMPVLDDSATTNLSDVPMVWATKNGKFMKMFKCRWCPHMNMRKTNVQDHEKMHQSQDATQQLGSIKCPYCSYVSMNVGIITAHVKIHEGILGKIHAFVDPNKSDEEQIQHLASQAAMKKLVQKALEASNANSKALTKEEKLIFCCQTCPARFFFLKEILIHSRFHGVKCSFMCDKCNYSVRQEPHLAIHNKVHTQEYQEKTRTLLTQYTPSTDYPPVPGLTAPTEAPSNSSALEPNKLKDFTISKDSSGQTRYKCSLCPSAFTKQITLQYHQSLHGANNPFKCDRCTYAAKTQDALNQHAGLHKRADEELEDAIKDVQKQEQPATPTNANHSQPPIKLKVIGLKTQTFSTKSSTPEVNDSNTSADTAPKKQFQYYLDEQIPISGVDLLRHKTQMEQHQVPKHVQDNLDEQLTTSSKPVSKYSRPCKNEEDEAKRTGDPAMNYPLYVDKVTGKTREKRYKCKLCPSAFEKVDQYNVHFNLHGASHKYKCRICDYSVKYFANFNMHINRHKYNETLESKKKGTPLPGENDPRYEPLVMESEDSSSREASVTTDQSQELLTTAEKQHILLQNKKGIVDKNAKEDEKDKRVFYCQFCPYANVRRDAVDSHSQRHVSNGGKGLYRCNFCDYTASQPNFLKDHTKVHFKPFKHVVPEGFIRHDQEEIFSTELITESQPEPKEHNKVSVFSHRDGSFMPCYQFNHRSSDDKENATEEAVDPNKLFDPSLESGVVIDFLTSEVVQAPAANILVLKPSSKSKCKDSFISPDSDFSFDNKVSDTEPESSDSGGLEVRLSKRRRTEKEESLSVGKKSKKSRAHSENGSSIAATNGVADEKKVQTDSPNFLGFDGEAASSARLKIKLDSAQS